MTPEAQRIAIAEACGWRDIKYRSSPTHPSGYINHDQSKDWQGATKIPDYLADLNAMHEAEKVLWQNDWLGYYSTLAEVMHVSLEDTALIHATATQRAEAFLRTLGKWTDTQ